MIARQIPDDPHWTQVVLAAKMKDLLLDFDRRPIGMPFRNRRPIHKTSSTIFSVGGLPTVEATAANAEISTRLRNVTRLLRVLKNAKLARDLALILVHEHLLRP